MLQSMRFEVGDFQSCTALHPITQWTAWGEKITEVDLNVHN